MNLTCPNCGQLLDVDESMQGKAMDCPHCAKPIGVGWLPPEPSVLPVASPLDKISCRNASKTEEHEVESMQISAIQNEPPEKGKKGIGGWTMGFALLGVAAVGMLRTSAGISLGAIPAFIVISIFGSIGVAIDEWRAK